MRLSPPAYKIIREIFETNQVLEQPEERLADKGPEFEASLFVVYERQDGMMRHGWLDDWSHTVGSPFPPSVIQELIDQDLIQERARQPTTPELEVARYTLTEKCTAYLAAKRKSASDQQKQSTDSQ